MSTDVKPDNGTAPKADPKPPATLPVSQEQIFANLKATIEKIGNTKKTKGAKRAYLRLIKAIQEFDPSERDVVLGDARRLWDLAGTDGDNDAALTAARNFAGSGIPA